MSEGEDARFGSFLDRGMQRRILLELRAVYPLSTSNLLQDMPAADAQFYFNLSYLNEHGLIEARIGISLDQRISWGGATITAKGLDFLEEDGGLSAILGVVTIKLHAETVRSLIEMKIDASTATEAEKSSLKAHLRKLPATALQLASTDLMRMGLQHLPDATSWLERLVGHL